MLKICIDPGHTQKYNKGVVSGYYEGDAVLDLGLRLKAALEEHDGVQVYMTRTKGSQNPDLAARGKVAILNGCELFVSLHSDASSKATTRGVTVIRSLKRPASAELGQKLAAAAADAMDTRLSPYSGAVGGVWTRAYPGNAGMDYYAVIRAAVGGDCVKAAYLIEHSFHTNKTDCTTLSNGSKRQQIADAEAAAIAEYYGLKKKATASAAPSDGTLYRVQVGAFGVKANALAMQVKLKAKGYTGIIKTGKANGKTLHRVQVGAFGVKANAVNLQKELKNKGFSAIIVEG